MDNMRIGEYDPEECYDLLFNNNTEINDMKGYIFMPFHIKGNEDFQDTITYEYLRKRIPKIVRYYGTLKVKVIQSDPAYLVASLVQYCANNCIDLVLFYSMDKYSNIYMNQYFKNVN